MQVIIGVCGGATALAVVSHKSVTRAGMYSTERSVMVTDNCGTGVCVYHTVLFTIIFGALFLLIPIKTSLLYNSTLCHAGSSPTLAVSLDCILCSCARWDLVLSHKVSVVYA